MLILKEPVTWISAVGTVMAVAGLFLSQYGGRERGKNEKEEKSSKEQED